MRRMNEFSMHQNEVNDLQCFAIANSMQIFSIYYENKID